jgi:hypothetical protein
VLRKRPYIKEEWCERALKDYVKNRSRVMAELDIGFTSKSLIGILGLSL